MYLPDIYAETDAAEIDRLIDSARLGLLITHGPEGLYASHLPMVWDPERRTLTGHLARANPHRALAEGEQALVVLTGPDAYVSPNWYPSKAEGGRVVPTWNYEAVHLYGTLEWFDAPDRLARLLVDLTDRHESAQPAPWRVADAPADYIERMLRAVVGVQMRVERIEAKRKLSQRQDASDRAGAIAGLDASPDARDRALAERMKAWAPA